MASLKVMLLMLFALVAAVQANNHGTVLKYQEFKYQLLLTQTPETSTLNNSMPGSSFSFNDVVRSVDNTAQFNGNVTGFAFFIPNPPPGALVIELLATFSSNANQEDSFVVVCLSSSETTVVTDCAVVGGTGIYAGATGVGRTRVTQFNPRDTILLSFSFLFFAIANFPLSELPPV